MIWLVVKHKLKEYAVWKPYFDRDIPEQVAAGLHVRELDRSVDDPNDIFIVFQADDLAKARAFVADPRLEAVMKAGGVMEHPTIYFMETVESYMKEK